MLKKIFFFSVLIFVVILSVFVVQKVFFGADNEKDEKNVEQRIEEAEKEVQERITNENKKRGEKIIKLIEGNVKGATLSESSSQILYYQKQRFLLTDFNGQQKNSVGARPFVSVKSIEWNKDKQKALIKDRDKYLIYDLNSNDVIELDENIDIAIWDYYGEKIIYKYYDVETKKRVLMIMDPEIEDSREIIIENIPYQYIDLLAVPKKSRVCFYPTPSVHSSGKLECYDWRNNELVFEYDGGHGSDYLWSVNGNALLTSYLQKKERKRLLIGATNEKGSEFRGFLFPTTVKKCVWSKDNKYVYCGMLGDMPDLAAMPNDWIEKEFYSTDTFWKINTTNGEKERLISVGDIPAKIDAINLFFDASEKYLFFTDRKTGDLYRLLI